MRTLWPYAGRLEIAAHLPEYTNPILLLLVKCWRKDNLSLPDVDQQFVSLHGSGSRRVTHLKEDDANTVDVNFL